MGYIILFFIYYLNLEIDSNKRRRYVADWNSVGAESRSRVKRDAAMERGLRHNPRRHIHRRQLLKQQFTRIRYLDQGKIRAVVACLTEVNTPLIIIRRNDSTLATYVNFVFIRAVIHTPPRETRRSVTHHRITLHLTET